MRTLRSSFLASVLVAAVSVTSAAQAQSFPPTIPWSAAPGASVFDAGTAGVGPFLNVTGDLAVKPEYSLNSWWAGGYFTVGGQKLGYVYHVMLLNAPTGQALTQSVSLTNSTTGEYYSDSQTYPVTPGMISSTGLNIVTPTGSLKGDFNDLQASANANGVKFDLHLRAASKAAFNGGTGIFPLLGMEIHQYSVPLLATTGTVTVNDRTVSVTGNSWFDRQWQFGNPAIKPKWTWFGINLTNGDSLSIWHAFDHTFNKDRSFATILHKDGSQTVAAVEASINASDNWQSPVTSYTFPVNWTLKIPQLKTSLNVVSRPKNQEFVSPQLNASAGGAYEGLSNVTGTYKGSPAAGVARLEMLGAWN